MATVDLSGISKFYGAMQALFDVSLSVPDGAFVVFVGPSGCGKSTLLRTIAGLESVDGGTVEIGGKDVTQLEPVDRDVSMVFQSYALYPHMSVRANMEFGMKVGGVGADERNARVEEAAKILQLSELLDRKPGQLSGGQRQRVAIGRSIVKKPKVFLFDEPLSNLDAKLRVQMRVELEALHDQLNATMIYVTHDQVEAMTMADQIVVLNAGRIEQVGSPMDLYHRPASEFVAGFIGSPAMNIFDTTSIFAGSLSRQEQTARLGIRPEHIVLGKVGQGDVDLNVAVKEQLGGESYLYLQGDDGERLVVKTDGEDATKAGQSVSISMPAHRVHQFDANGVTLSNNAGGAPV
ncbi:sn-glycerol-3-phosphate ABC transporter ATP-binding protein UgpC [uncultured Roseobacter sp.]|uniref:ABC transporter ATP-binding protein n=1 Tax=uncultured Roseobacter sp. TaxID=114847 RepID=UPI0026139613|nr:sn-glycerol-3-phosphate ABC transporter ATP-binding protein UgpC [uncultured Roseobacter sp.]